ncbi:DUF6777 domain-containing protein [Actinomycetospora sp. TBRC 11914]|uniref:DUF6777 domain-containing protein n=1 Tax=Actinomycetospora sp. TBRC 11914 TaxID=2729387 RepID=UPI00145DCA8D|nr:DUF6777 domain-containing protein [Actinomycetospora sp. TBRC 11914]NMO91524.1 hypothetical protein [Actinomycetospora sp. TBRC 11914]
MTFDPRTVQPTHPGQYGTPTVPGQKFAGSAPPPLSRPRTKRPLAGKIVAGVVAAGLVVGGAATWFALTGSPAEAAVQSTSFAGANPTTVPFGVDAPQVAAVAATGPQAGDTTGLYAATTPPACTTADFLTQLQADPAKLAAFGGVYGIGADDVPAFVDSLAPVVLRANTSVTDHPYSDGAFVPQPAILAAGTAVLVNSYGEPTVKCFNGNPLTAGPQAADAITVVPTAQVITNYSFTTIDNTRVVVIPGKPDPKPHPGPNPTTTPQPDPELVKKAEEAKATAEKARAEATAAREKADAAKTAATIAQTNLNQAEQDLARAIADGANPTVINELTKVRDQAKQDLETKQNQAKYADAAATSAEGTADQADRNAKEAKDKADASAKAQDTKHQSTKDQDTKDETPKDKPAVQDAGQAPAQGQEKTQDQQVQKPVQVQKPATVTPVCPKVVTEATATATCPATVSADTAQKAPAGQGTTGTGKDETGTGSTKGTDSTGKSSSGSDTKTESKEGTDK